MDNQDLIYRLRKRAEIRRQISTRKSVQEGAPDRIAELLEEAADALESKQEAIKHSQRWVGLTDDEIKEIIGPWGDTPIKGYTRKLFDQIEAKLREKNEIRNP